MATVRIYYSRADNNQSDYDLYWFGDNPEKIDHDDFNVNFHYRTKVSFGDNDYVDIDTGDETVISWYINCLLYTSPSPRDKRQSRMPSSA